MAHPEHFAIICEGAAAWNAWRRNTPDGRPDLADVVLPLGMRQWGPVQGGPIDFSHTTLARAGLSHATLTGAVLLQADLSGCDLTGALMSRADLRQAVLSDVLAGGADFAGAQLAGARLHGAALHEARNLTQEQVNAADGDAATTLPVGLSAPSHWRGNAAVSGTPRFVPDRAPIVTAPVTARRPLATLTVALQPKPALSAASDRPVYGAILRNEPAFAPTQRRPAVLELRQPVTPSANVASKIAAAPVTRRVALAGALPLGIAATVAAVLITGAVLMGSGGPPSAAPPASLATVTTTVSAPAPEASATPSHSAGWPAVEPLAASSEGSDIVPAAAEPLTAAHTVASVASAATLETETASGAPASLAVALPNLAAMVLREETALPGPVRSVNMPRVPLLIAAPAAHERLRAARAAEVRVPLLQLVTLVGPAVLPLASVIPDAVPVRLPDVPDEPRLEAPAAVERSRAERRRRDSEDDTQPRRRDSDDSRPRRRKVPEAEDAPRRRASREIEEPARRRTSRQEDGVPRRIERSGGDRGDSTGTALPDRATPRLIAPRRATTYEYPVLRPGDGNDNGSTSPPRAAPRRVPSNEGEARVPTREPRLRAWPPRSPLPPPAASDPVSSLTRPGGATAALRPVIAPRRTAMDAPTLGQINCTPITEACRAGRAMCGCEFGTRF